MHSGSDSDSFDEGDLTARGRKGKGKADTRSKEKGKQKAKDVRLSRLLRYHRMNLLN
jgi:hypothetical protein